ncbi:uncharacterized protein KY384_005612 [Bacidia gigantensis]|uniref:uncharacterized protein n=1 Tax=Bacidia gigantensis TaxID=2732470 RepID=UPI001D03DE26|nr:uncharacterized protein KY384_005612 [Bacidia gigantensis]KAG8530129.1 hypothetical protein KY384_005612 [Bacidia gigantensis]
MENNDADQVQAAAKLAGAIRCGACISANLACVITEEPGCLRCLALSQHCQIDRVHVFIYKQTYGPENWCFKTLKTFGPLIDPLSDPVPNPDAFLSGLPNTAISPSRVPHLPGTEHGLDERQRPSTSVRPEPCQSRDSPSFTTEQRQFSREATQPQPNEQRKRQNLPPTAPQTVTAHQTQTTTYASPPLTIRNPSPLEIKQIAPLGHRKQTLTSLTILESAARIVWPEKVAPESRSTEWKNQMPTGGRGRSRTVVRNRDRRVQLAGIIMRNI